jgi:hypothetical protein
MYPNLNSSEGKTALNNILSNIRSRLDLYTLFGWNTKHVRNIINELKKKVSLNGQKIVHTLTMYYELEQCIFFSL